VDPGTVTQSEEPVYTTTFKEYSDVHGATQMSEHTTETPAPCACVSQTNYISISDAELVQRLLDIKKNLTVNKTALSSTVRRKTSAPDERMSSASMGVVGICVVIAIIMLVVASDIGYIIQFAKS
jgi:hypothetical protein